jgi:predicted ATP-grasp superfamily ATP-dependent carboligase
MNLLVTNTRNGQAYAIVRALRPFANRIVATMEGDNRLTARLSHAANSRFVDKRYYTPSPAKDWRAGRVQKENSEGEEAYVQAVLRICEEEEIDTIFPSFDPHVYVFAKNKEKFERLGIVIPVPDYETVLIPLDKYRTIQAAKKAGFPCPKTYLFEGENDLRKIADGLGFPLWIKPRFTSPGRGMEVAKDFLELSEKARHINKKQEVLFQEFIPGKEKQHPYLILNKQGELQAAFCTKRWRHLFRVNLQFPTAEQSTDLPSYITHATRLLQEFGWWGGVTVEMKIGSRDGIPKLMEINPRLGYRLWLLTELDINAPLICLAIARDEQVTEMRDYPVEVTLFDPVEDVLALGYALLDLVIYKCRISIQGKPPVDLSNPPMTLKELMKRCKQIYLVRKKKVFSPYFRYFTQDILVSLLWWLQFVALMLSGTKQLGR